MTDNVESPAENETLLILGAGVRAAAWSARRGGVPCCGGDLFADVDLRAVAPAEVVRNYPQGLLSVARKTPSGAWMYTGALENHPDLIEALRALRPLYGNAGETLRRARDPFHLEKLFAGRGISYPEPRPANDAPPADGAWLCKAFRSAGGRRIEIWDGANRKRGFFQRREDFYFQRLARGTACSATYLAARGECRLLGVSEQLLGLSWCGAKGFQYAGSLGPLSLDAEFSAALSAQLQEIGSLLAGETGLVGLFGVDLLIDEGRVRPIEVNPRYPASVEILERGGTFSAVAGHVRACRDGVLDVIPSYPPGRLWGKVIYYGRRECTVGAAFASWIERENADPHRPMVADIPAVGTHQMRGGPVVTILADGKDRIEVVARLRDRVAGLERALYGRCFIGTADEDAIEATIDQGSSLI